MTREGLRRTLADATSESTGTTIGAHVPAGRLPEVRGQVGRALKGIFQGVPHSVSMSVRSGTFTLPGQEGRDHPELAVFETWTGIDRHARLAGGRWPRAGGGEIEAALPATAAHFVHAGLGDVLTLRGRVDRTSVVKVRVVGLFEVPDPSGYFWQDDRLITTGVQRLDYTTYGPFVVPPDVFAERFARTGVEARFTVLPDLARLDVDGLVRLRDRVAAADDTLLKAGGGGTRFTVATELSELTRQLRDAVLVARSTMLIPVIQLVLLAGCAWLLVARLLADHRRGEVALLRTRGMGMRQFVRLGLAEGLLIVLPAAVLGPLLAGPLLRLAGHAPAVRASGLRLDARTARTAVGRLGGDGAGRRGRPHRPGTARGRPHVRRGADRARPATARRRARVGGRPRAAAGGGTRDLAAHPVRHDRRERGRRRPAHRGRAPGWGEVAADRAETRSRLRDAPLGAGLQGALVLGFGTALAFAVIAFVVNAAVTAGERAREFGVLRVLGVRPRQVAGMLAIEQAYLVALGLLGGTVLGLVVARLAVPHIVLGVRAARPYPPVATVLPWPVLLAMIAGVTAVLGLVLPPVVGAPRRRDVAAGLRAGEDH